MLPPLISGIPLAGTGEQWLYELKFDGYRGLAIKNHPSTRLYSRNSKDLTSRFLPIVHAVQNLPAKHCVIDGEIVCLDNEGRPCFEDLQNYTEGKHSLYFYAFDLLHFESDCLHDLSLTMRKERLTKLLHESAPCLRLSASLEGEPGELVKFCGEHRLEGLVAKKRDSLYKPGQRGPSWVKFKTRQEATFLVGGFLPSVDGFSSIAVGFKRAGEFHYAGKLEVYFPKSAKAEVLREFLSIASPSPGFVHVPRKRNGDTWSAGITMDEMERFVWVDPKLKAAVEYQEWTRAGYLRHAKVKEISKLA